MARIFIATEPNTVWQANMAFELPAGASRHVQVLRMQPGQSLTVFNGQGGEWSARITQMGRSNVALQLEAYQPIEREASRAVHLALGIPANERMDWLVEKATELGVASIQPLTTERSVLRLAGERAEKKQAHWQAIAIAACEQCGRNRVPRVHPLLHLEPWLALGAAAATQSSAAPAPSSAVPAASAQATRVRYVLSLASAAQRVQQAAASTDALSYTLLSGPEGGLGSAEEALAIGQGFAPLSLGPRVLRAETAPLAALVALTLQA